MKSLQSFKTVIVMIVVSMMLSPMVFADDLPNWRPNTQDGTNIYETVGSETTDFKDVKVRIGGHSAQQFQMIRHKHKTTPVFDTTGAQTNGGLVEIGNGFNTATANLTIDAQFGSGVYMNMVLYLSSRHHTETWVKGGYLQVDNLDFLKTDFINSLFNHISLKIGHFEINYGDQHFRRTDNGNAMFNPFVGNYIIDAFTTEIGVEVYYKYVQGLIFMGAITGGEIKGNVEVPEKRSPSFYGKLGYDKQFTDAFRARLTASFYATKKSASNTLFSGDRGGSRYYQALEMVGSKTGSNFRSGRFNPNFSDKVLALQVSGLVKYKGLEVHPTFDFAKGRTAKETKDRQWIQVGGDLIYRLFKNENLYFGARGAYAAGELPNQTRDEVYITRVQGGLGWYVNKYLLLKLEYVQQNHHKYPTTDLHYKGEFKGAMIESVVGF